MSRLSSNLQNNGDGSSLISERPFPSVSHKVAAERLVSQFDSFHSMNWLCSPSSSSHGGRSYFQRLRLEFPWKTMAGQLLWTSLVTLVAFLDARSRLPADATATQRSSFASSFWEHGLIAVPSSLSFGVGWALFLLLSFFMNQASKHHQEGRATLAKLSFVLRRGVRHLRQNYPAGTWHEGDHDRILAHLVAYPLAFYDRKHPTLRDLLHSDDVRDIANAPSAHYHCMAVVRAYFHTTEPDTQEFESKVRRKLADGRSPAGTATRNVSSILLDEIDTVANSLRRVCTFRPAVAYVNHLTVFVYIWLMFMPLTLISSAGWFTIIWSLLVTYAVAMLFKIAHWLNEPFGKPTSTNYHLGALCAEVAYEVLVEGVSSPFDNLPSHRSAIDDSPGASLSHLDMPWLRDPLPSPGQRGSSTSASASAVRSEPRALLLRFFAVESRQQAAVLMAFMVWAVAATAVVHFLSPRGGREHWWWVYLPIENATIAYLSSVIGVMFGFWLQNAYGRYRRSLTLITDEILPLLHTYMYQFGVVIRHNSLHYGDVERFLAHIAALPVTLHAFYSPDDSLLCGVDGLLSARDAALTRQAPDATAHVLAVLAAYIDGADNKYMNVGNTFQQTFGAAIHMMQLFRPQLEAAVVELQALKQYNIFHPLRSHLTVVVYFFLAVLPVAAAVCNGYFSLLFVLPTVYCALRLITIGFQLDHPFGDGPDDIPMTEICARVRRTVHDAYHVTVLNREDLPREVLYDRRDFTPSPKDATRRKAERESRQVKSSRRVLFKMVLTNLPKVPLPYLVYGLLWNVLAVFATYFAAKLYPTAHNGACRAWCSPLDIDRSILWNVGRILFTIQSFRAYDALSRYDTGSQTLGAVCTNVTAMAMDIVQSFKDGRFHAADKERLIAHVVQIPLALRDKLLNPSKPHNDEENNTNFEGAQAKGDIDVEKGIEKKKAKTMGGESCSLLSEEEERSVMYSLDPLETSIHTIESYFVRKYYGQMSSAEEARDFQETQMSGATVHAEGTYAVVTRLYELRKQIATLLTMKRYPFVRGYRFHQQVFIGFWLACLPLSMTAKMGFLSILTSCIICLGVVALETGISDLADPFGKSRTHNLHLPHDVPVADMCDSAVSDILSTVHDTRWDIDGTVHACDECPDAYLGRQIDTTGEGRLVSAKFDLPVLEKAPLKGNSCKNQDEDDEDARKATGEDSFSLSCEFKRTKSIFQPQRRRHLHSTGPEEFEDEKVHNEFDVLRNEGDASVPAKLSYFLYAIPWSFVQAVTMWAAFACLFSYWSRDQAGDEVVRWWISPLSIASSESTSLAFITFNLLAFYVHASHNRYCKAANVWYGELQWLLHSITAEFRINWPSGAIHERDQARLAGHLAALPYALRSDLRDSRAIREVRSLLSPTDFADLSCANNMAVHAMAVVRSYYNKGAVRPETIQSTDEVKQGRLNLMFRIDLPILESTIQTALYLRDSDIAPQFTVLLNFWLAIWFFFLPFILVEFSGWLTILAVPVIAISILGMRQLARAIVKPYGTQLNDLDLDQLAHDLSADVISAYRTARLPSQTPHLQPYNDGLFKKNGGPHAPLAGTAMINPDRTTKLSGMSSSSFAPTISPSTSQSSSDSGLSTEPIFSSLSKMKPTINFVDKMGESLDTTESTEQLAKLFVCEEAKRLPLSVARRRLGKEQLKVALQAMSKYEFLFIVTWSLFVLTLAFLLGRFRPLPPGDAPCDPWFCSILAADTSTMEYIGYGLFLILSFRMADSHERYAEAVRLWHEDLVGSSYLLLNRFFLTFKPGFFHPGDMERVGAHVEAFAINMMSDLRACAQRRQDLYKTRNMGTEDIEHLLRAERSTDATVDVIRGYLLQAERLPPERKVFSGNDLTRIFIHLRRMSRAAPSCNVIKNVQIPIGYLFHLRMFILMWIVVLPFALVQQTGWTSVIWCVVISYAVIGIEHWASELSDPFGCDSSDIALENHIADIITMVQNHNQWAGKIVERANISEGREAFPTPLLTQGNAANSKTIDNLSF